MVEQNPVPPQFAELMPDPRKVQRIAAGVTKAQGVIPDNPAGLKQYLVQYVLPLMRQIIETNMLLTNGVGASLNGVQHLSVQLAALNANEGIMELASYVGGLAGLVSEDSPDMEQITNTVFTMVAVVEERFNLSLGDYGTEDGSTEGAAESTTSEPVVESTPPSAPENAASSAPEKAAVPVSL